MLHKLPSAKILGVNVTTASEDEIVDFIFTRIKKSQDKFYIVTPNPEIIVAASRSKRFEEILNGAEVSLPDGAGVLAAGNILKKGIKRRITGTDLMVRLCRESAERAFTVGFLGGRGGVAEKTAECLVKKYPDLRVKFAGEEFENRTHIDILFVALGAPKQEEWIAENLSKIDVTVAMGVGGAFDYISGKVPRAPKFVRQIGMEWGYRLVRQPWRLKRQLALPLFISKVLKERFI